MSTTIKTCPKCGKTFYTDKDSTICSDCRRMKEDAEADYLYWRDRCEAQGDDNIFQMIRNFVMCLYCGVLMKFI